MSHTPASKQQQLHEILQRDGVKLKSIVMEPGALRRLPDVLISLNAAPSADGQRPKTAMICDGNTYRAAGQQAEQILSAAGMPLSQTVCLPAAHLHATETAVQSVDEMLKPCGLLIAVGSGTVHDITRYTATARGIDFVSVPTAASVDGYLSSISAMTWHGVKRSFPAKPPIAMVADSTVIAAAPYALTASGVGDLLGKYSAVFDWRVAHMLTGEPIDEDFVIPLEEAALKEVVGITADIRAQKPEAVEAVMYGLTLSGLAMQAVGNSRPASGSEHHISHLIEMNVLGNEDTALHGEKVGVAEILVCDRIRRILAQPLTEEMLPAYSGFPTDRVRRVFGNRADEVMDNENTPDPLAGIDRAVLLAKWDGIRELAARTLPTGEEIRRLLTAVGAPVTLSDIRIPDSLADTLWTYAPYVRRRLTFMRVAGMIQENRA